MLRRTMVICVYQTSRQSLELPLELRLLICSSTYISSHLKHRIFSTFWPHDVWGESLPTHFVGMGIYAPRNKVLLGSWGQQAWGTLALWLELSERKKQQQRPTLIPNLFLFVKMATLEFRFVKYNGLKTLWQILYWYYYESSLFIRKLYSFWDSGTKLMQWHNMK